MYLVRQAWENSVDPYEMLQTGCESGSTLLATYPAILHTTVGSKLDLFKFYIKYGKKEVSEY